MNAIVFVAFFIGKTTTFTFAVAKEFESWALEDTDHHLVCIDRNVRIIGFHVGCKVNMIYLDLLITAFRMNHPGNNYFLLLIQPYIDKKKYKEVIIVTPLPRGKCYYCISVSISLFIPPLCKYLFVLITACRTSQWHNI